MLAGYVGICLVEAPVAYAELEGVVSTYSSSTSASSSSSSSSSSSTSSSKLSKVAGLCLEMWRTHYHPLFDTPYGVKTSHYTYRV